MLTTPACFVFHHARGFEDADGRLVIDSVVLPEFPDFDSLTVSPDDDGTMLRALDFEQVPINIITRITCDLKTGEVTRRQPRARAAEFPTVGAVLLVLSGLG